MLVEVDVEVVELEAAAVLEELSVVEVGVTVVVVSLVVLAAVEEEAEEEDLVCVSVWVTVLGG